MSSTKHAPTFRSNSNERKRNRKVHADVMETPCRADEVYFGSADDGRECGTEVNAEVGKCHRRKLYSTIA